jgi:hypothetical protein
MTSYREGHFLVLVCWLDTPITYKYSSSWRAASKIIVPSQEGQNPRLLWDDTRHLILERLISPMVFLQCFNRALWKPSLLRQSMMFEGH